MRVRKTVETPASLRTTEYFYTGSQLTAERDSDGTLYRYLYGPGGAPLEVRVTTGTVTASYAVHTDALGSVVALSDGSGVPVATYAYDPWGAPLETRLLTASSLDRAVASRQPFRYRGYTLDAETGLYYLPARYYDPQACRFLSPDPAAPSAGNPASLNPYVYCEDDPIGASDPTGAIMDADGDGKVSSIDCLELAVRNAKGQAAKDRARRRADDAWKAFKAQQAALAVARARALEAAKAAARDRAARMAMAQARLGASLAMKAVAKEATNEGYADGLEALQKVAGVAGLVAGVVLLCTPVGWVGAGVAVTVAATAAVVGLAAGAGRAGLGDDDYGWKNFAFEATVTFVTAGVGGGIADDAAIGVYRVSGAAWTAAEATMMACDW